MFAINLFNNNYPFNLSGQYFPDQCTHRQPLCCGRLHMMQDLVLCNVVAIKRVLECVVRGPLAFKVLFCCHHLVEEASNYSNKRKHFLKFTVRLNIPK